MPILSLWDTEAVPRSQTLSTDLLQVCAERGGMEGRSNWGAKLHEPSERDGGSLPRGAGAKLVPGCLKQTPSSCSDVP